jgi:AraC-like DNA-binding protein
MENWMIFADLFLIVGMVTVLIFTVFLRKKKATFSRNLLLVFFTQAFLFFLLHYALNHQYYTLAGLSFVFGNATGMFQGPLIYFFILSLVTKSQRLPKRFLLHLIPYLLKVVIYNIPIASALIFRTKPWFRNANIDVNFIANVSENVYLLAYLIASLLLIRKITQISKEEYSSLSNKDLEWLVYLATGIMALVVVDTLFSVAALFEPTITKKLMFTILFGYVILYLILGYKGIFQTRILLPSFLLIQHGIETESQKDKENHSPNQKSIEKPEPEAAEAPPYTEQEAQLMSTALIHQLETEKIYLDPELRLKDLAETINTTEKKLSYFINSEMGYNFFALINKYRVEEVKQKISSGEFEHLSILGIAYDSGFQSKSSFNRVFKQSTGKAPSEFRKRPSS